ncbi:MAG: hypothetical protein M3Y69_02420 [Verrucomicrobiota bacterium]|nr:hypothetical protein [Verrucomicrobiota bacterium]
MGREGSISVRPGERFFQPYHLDLLRRYTRGRQPLIDGAPGCGIWVDPGRRVLSTLGAIDDNKLRIFRRVGISTQLEGLRAFAREFLSRIRHPDRDHDDLPLVESAFPDAFNGLI